MFHERENANRIQARDAIEDEREPERLPSDPAGKAPEQPQPAPPGLGPGWLHLREALDAVLGGKEIASTEPVGCTIQRAIRESAAEVTWSGRVAKIVHDLIGGTRNRRGLRIKATLDTNEYEKGVEFSRDQMESINIRRHKTDPDWNYTIAPHSRKLGSETIAPRRSRKL
jgi:hypothetical protein